jgi:hypothetical protein
MANKKTVKENVADKINTGAKLHCCKVKNSLLNSIQRIFNIIVYG